MSELLAPRTPGAALKAAREKRGLSIAEVVEATRMKPHIIQALENNDYSTIAAPLYGKGFIKLYASFLGLDPDPLIRHYLNYYARSVRPTLKTEVPPPSAVNDGIPQPSPLARFRESGNSVLTNLANTVATAGRDSLHGLAVAWGRLTAPGTGSTSRMAARRDRQVSEDSEPVSTGRFAAVGFAIVVVVMLIASAVYWFAGNREPVSPRLAVQNPGSSVAATHALRLAVPPPAPYIKLK